MDEDLSWAERLKAYRKARGWSQGQLADALGIALMQVNRWETGKFQPNETSQKRILALIEGRFEQDKPLSNTEKLDLLLKKVGEIEKMLRKNT